MISNEAAAFLWDARRAAERIRRFVAGRSFEDYVAGDMLYSAVERQFEIIGEAFVGLRRLDPNLAAQIPDVVQIIAFRNVLVHAYTSINHDTVWKVIQNDLPRPEAVLNSLLGTAPPL